MNIPTSNMIGLTDLTRDTSRVVKAVSEGENFLVMRSNKPVAAVVGPEALDRLQELDEREEDMQMLYIGLVRMFTDNGSHIDLEDVAAEYGIGIDDVDED